MPSNSRTKPLSSGSSRFRDAHRKGAAGWGDFSRLKHQHPYFGLVPCTANGVDFVLFHANDDVIAWEYLWFGDDAYEHEIVKTWVTWCSETPGVIYDIGGYTALMSVLAAKVSPTNQVHLFEPMARTIERAKINVRANGVDRRVTLHNKAASDHEHDAKINLYRNEDFLGPGNSIEDKNLPIIATQSIRCVSVDEALPGGTPSVAKIDVEGHELATLRGMQGTLKRSRPRMIVEVWEHSRRDVLGLLGDLGYSCQPFEPDERRVMNFRCIPD